MTAFACTVGWSKDYRNEGFGEQRGIKSNLINLISSVRTLLRGKLTVQSFPSIIILFSQLFLFFIVPLIFVNIVVIAYELLLG